MHDPRHLVISHAGRELAGAVRPGESWAAAARRTAASALGEPEPVDLGAEPLRFRIDEQSLTLRAMTRGDLDLLTRWRQAPHLRRWWDSDGEPTPSAVAAHYGPDIDGLTPTRMWVVEVAGRSIGFLQDYLVRDYPDYAVLTPDPDALGVDYAVGELAWTGQGMGTRMLWAWMQRARRRFPDVTTYFAAPDHRNAPSRRMLEKAGFVEGLWFDEPQRDGSVSTVVGYALDVPRVLG